MREIKFRAWVKEQEYMWYSDSKKSEDRIYFLIINSSGPYLSPIHHEEYEEYTEFELMQYTGLKDRNGKEIYEGDIVRIAHPFKDRGYVGEIIYDKYTFTAKGFYFTHHDNPGDPFESLKYLEVIGNIYENPNLLEE